MFITTNQIPSEIIYTSSSTDCWILHSFTPDKENENSMGFTFTCGKFMTNIKNCIENGECGLRLSWDGTYRLTCNGWVLILFGSIYTKFKNDGSISHSFIPFTCTMTKTESIVAFRSIIDSFFTCLNLLNINKDRVNVLSFSQDHTQTGALGVDYLRKKLIKPIILLSCETHVRRKVNENKSLLAGKIKQTIHIYFLLLIIF
jgi:hypothetical protein